MEMEELKALFRVCVHIKSNGIRCGSPALTGSNFCWQHMGGTVAGLARARSTTHDATARLDFAYPGDRESIQHNFFLIAQALNDGQIDTRTANTYIRLFRAAEQNLHRWEKKQKNEAKNHLSQAETGVPHVSTLRRGWSEASNPTQLNEASDPTQSSEALNPTQLSEASNPSRCHPEAEIGAQATNAAEGPAVSPASPNDVILSRAPEGRAVEGPAFSPAPPNGISKREPPEIDWKKYDHRFREIDKVYSNQPDYADRINATIQEILDSEAAAHPRHQPPAS